MDNEELIRFLRDKYYNPLDHTFIQHNKYGIPIKVATSSIYQNSDYTMPLYQRTTASTKEQDMTTKLYEISHGTETLYGHKLATNSQGQWVMEIKGSGDVIAVDKANVQEVLPYTIGVQFETGKMIYSYLADAGKFKEGEFYILDAPHGRAIVQVVEVDTKSAGATKQFTPLAKLLTE